MNNVQQPYPPLAIVEARLFDENFTGDRNGKQELPEEPLEDAIDPVKVNLPDQLKDKIARMMALSAPAAPAAGSIWSLAYSGIWRGRAVLGRIPILLNQPFSEAGAWQGYIVSPDADYAATDDVVLDPGQQAISPLATVVQTWNPVRAIWDGQARYLGQVNDETLAAIRAVAREATPAFPPAGQPCRMDYREVAGAGFILTGDWLGNNQDLRWRYRELYRELALNCFPANDQEIDLDV